MDAVPIPGEKTSYRTIPILILLVVAVLAAVEAYGFAKSHFFRRELWFPDGPEDFVQFAGLYAACATAILILVPWLFARLCFAALMVLTAIVLGPQAFFAIVYFPVSAWALGSLLLRRDNLLAALAFQWRAMRQRLPNLLRLPAAIGLCTWGERAAFAALVLFLTAHWFAVLKPEASADGLSMHLAIPANIAAFTRASNRGIASVTIDGLDAGTFDLYSRDVQWQSRLRFPDLGSGPHVVVIRVTGQSRPGAKGNYVDVDSFEVKP